LSHGNWPKELVAMRTRYWAQLVKQAAGFEGKKDQEFIDACKYGHTNLVELGGMTWAGFLSGKNNPLYKSIDLVEKVLPDTAMNFYKGPRGLELWKIIADSGNVETAEELFNNTLVEEYGNEVNNWDLSQKVFWFILPILAFPVAPFVEKMTKEIKIVGDKKVPLIQEGEELPWSDILHLIDRGTINTPLNGEEIFLSSLLAVCDDTRKIYTLENTFSTFGPKLISYAFDRYKQGADLGFSATFIVAALGLIPLTKKVNNNSLQNIAKLLVEGLTLGAIDYEVPEVGADLTDYVRGRWL